MAIATGGVVPDGADSVVPIEDVEERDGVVVVPGEVRAGANVRARGGDLVSGDPVVAAGVRLGAVQLGALAAAGVTSVRCHRRPADRARRHRFRAPLGRGATRPAARSTTRTGSSSRPRSAAPAPPSSGSPRSRTTRSPRARRSSSGLEADVLVTSGGVSVGRLRPRARHGGRARGRGGLLARRRASRQADRVRDPGADARLRASREPGVLARRLRALRAPGAACACRASPSRGRPFARAGSAAR